MNTTHSQSDNELIAAFMGLQVYQTHEAMQAVPLDELKEWVLPKQIKYHESWDWLMPVVEKISRIECDNESSDTFYPRTFGMLDENKCSMVRINRSPLWQHKTLIGATYIAVVEFIKCYNQQQP